LEGPAAEKGHLHTAASQITAAASCGAVRLLPATGTQLTGEASEPTSAPICRRPRRNVQGARLPLRSAATPQQVRNAFLIGLWIVVLCPRKIGPDADPDLFFFGSDKLFGLISSQNKPFWNPW
jgi:hypothetical protein